MTYLEFYKTGRTYKANQFTCEVKDVRFTKTGRITAQIENDINEIFWTDAVNPSKEVDYVNSRKKLIFLYK
jgi:hypothetical protein